MVIFRHVVDGIFTLDVKTNGGVYVHFCHGFWNKNTCQKLGGFSFLRRAAPAAIKIHPRWGYDLFITRYDFRTNGAWGLFKKSDDFSSNWDWIFTLDVKNEWICFFKGFHPSLLRFNPAKRENIFRLTRA
jgi:hypothetical protein